MFIIAGTCILSHCDFTSCYLATQKYLIIHNITGKGDVKRI